MPNVPKDINTQLSVFVCVSACTGTHRNPFLFSKCLETQSKTQGLGFTVHLCPFMSVASQERTISAQLQQRAHNKAQPSCSRMQYNWKQYPQFRHLVLKALLRGIEIWSVNIRGPSWQRNKDKPCYVDVVMKTQKIRKCFSVGLTAYIHSIGPHQVFVLQIRTCLKYALNTLLTFTPVYACS